MKLAWALYWASRGFRVFPLWPDSKTPAWTDFLNRATTDEATIRATWADEDYNIGAVPAGQIMVDLDEKPDETGAPREGIAHAREAGLDFDTLLVRTPTGGLHAWYQGPPVGNRAGILKGVDIRGVTGFGVMPGSTIHGARYEIAQDKPLAPVQQFILDRTRAPRERSAEQLPLLDLDTPSALNLATVYLDSIAGAVRGVQNDTAFRVAAHLRDLGLSDTTCAELMDVRWAVKCEPPIPTEEIEEIVSNAYAYAQNAPGSKHPALDFANYKALPLPPIGTPAAPPDTQLELFAENPFFAFGNMIDLDELKPRDWVLKRFMERGAVTTLVAPGGVGKSQLSLTLAAILAAGEATFFGFPNIYAGRPQYSVVFNAEDDEQEMSARLHALCAHMGWDYRTIKPYICLASGKRIKHMRLMTKESGVIRVTDEGAKILGWLIDACRRYSCPVLALDPANKLHELNENDNIEMSRFMSLLTGLAELAGAAVLLSHHMNKPAFASGTPYAGNASSSRGAGEIVNASRAAYTLSPATSEDINRFSLTEDRSRRLLRLDNAKLNRALLTGDATWLERVSVNLWNGEEVGCFAPADPRDDTTAAREAMARVLEAEITGLGQGAVPIADAARMLMANDTIYGNLTTALVRSRIERLLLNPITLPGGQTVAFTQKGPVKMVSVS